MKKLKLAAILILTVLLTSCGMKSSDIDSITSDNKESITTDVVKTEPKSSEDMFGFIIDIWKNDACEKLWEYADDELTELLDEKAFVHMFETITDTFGKINDVSEPNVISENGYDMYSTTLYLENADVSVTLSLKGAKIAGFIRDIRFTKEFEAQHDNICERYFLLNGLNAVYTCADGDEIAPVVLMISGSGPCDCNETVGMLEPLADIAVKLAERGVSSLRFEKRTLRFAQDFKNTDGIEKEYLEDCRAALSYLRSMNDTDGVYLLGHSLGGQIAAYLAETDGNIDGIALLMSSARHLADIACDQYSTAQPTEKVSFEQYRDTAKVQTALEATGRYYYFGATDAYWASYNVIDTVNSIKKADVPTVIINSTADAQTFPSDIALWSETFSDNRNVKIAVYDDMSHFGYKIDMSDARAIYSPAEMPNEIIEDIMQIID